MNSKTCGKQRKRDFNGSLARSGAWEADTLQAVTISIIFSGVHVPPLVPHWLSTMRYTFFLRCHLDFLDWVILKYASLGIGQNLEVGFK
jgi:hypothetical protein